jgi:nicotinate-nucleotide adenylyltransferase
VRALILGGTFNPVHIGHLFIAEEARTALGYDRVVFVPANIPSHKDPGPVADPPHRLRMLALALAPYPWFQLDDCEVARGGTSYTIDTVGDLAARLGIEGRPGLLIGDDLLAGFPSWKNAPVLAGLVDLIVVRRTAEPAPGFPYPHAALRNPVLSVSSSEIRRRVGEGRTIRFLVPDGVAAYIAETGLYA